jgi:hypothetical protein
MKAMGQKAVSFEGTVCAGGELLRSPVSGLPCVHWRLRIVQHITPRMQLVHEVASPEAFEIVMGNGGAGGSSATGAAAGRIRLDPESARIHAAPVLHREGTPGAIAAGRQFGLDGPLRVEEVMIHHGEAVVAEGILDEPSAEEGPFRATTRGLELLDPTLRLATPGIGPALLPWALGTAAALLGSTAAATYVAWHYHRLNLPHSRHHSQIDPLPLPSEMRPPEAPHPRLP